MSEPNVVLQMQNITKEFPGVKALEDVSIQVKAGDIHAICGENGAGKSTLMNIISGVYPSGTYEGEFRFGGKLCAYKSVRDSEDAGIGIIHQELALIPELSVAENIFLGNERAPGQIIDWDATRQSAQELIDRVGLEASVDDKIIDLGVGRQQLVEIAKALSKNVKLLILDEPTAALNEDDSENLLKLMRQLRDRGITMIVISHKLDEIAEIADATTVLRDGQTVKTIDHKTHPFDNDEIIRLMVGRELSNLYLDREAKIGSEILRIENWTVQHPVNPDRRVVDSASLQIHRGEVVGLAGLMGAGRTELAMSVFGKSYGRYLTGEIYKNGELIVANSVREAIRHGLAYVTEDRKQFGLNLLQDIKTNISAAALQKLSRYGVVDRDEEFSVASDLRAALNIRAPGVSENVGNLSGGNQQKVVFSKWMYTDPDVLMLDEPTRGIDVGAKYEIYQIINELVDSGKGVLVISSELPELIGICDRIFVMQAGRITGDLMREEFSEEALMRLMAFQEEETASWRS